MSLLKTLEKRVIFERLVIGLEEPVLIKGIGEIQAKVDSGNGGFNVLHGTDIYQEGDVLHFTTIDGNGNPKHVAKNVIDHIQVNIGGGHIQDRPVVELDIKFANTLYKKIPFSITDRSDNDMKILISKSFVDDELDALIDVGEVNISKDNIQVDTMNESTEEPWWKTLNVNTIDIKDRKSYLIKLDGELSNFEEHNKTDADYDVVKKRFQELYDLCHKPSMTFHSSTAQKIAGASTVHGNNQTMKGDSSKRQMVEKAEYQIETSTIIVGFRTMALFVYYSQNYGSDNVKWINKNKPSVSNFYQTACVLLKSHKVSDEKANKTVEDIIAHLGGIEASLNTVGKGIVGNMLSRPLNTGYQGVKNAMSNAWDGVGRASSGALRQLYKKEDEETLVLEGAETSMDNIITSVFHGAQKPNLDEPSLRSSIEQNLTTLAMLKHQGDAFVAEKDKVIDGETSEGFLTKFNNKCQEIADAANQIYRGTFSGSLLGMGVGFIKKFWNGGGPIMKIFKGAALALCFANPPLVAPLMVAYAVQQAIRASKSSKIKANPQQVKNFHDSISKSAKRVSKTSVDILGEVAAKKDLIKTDTEILNTAIKQQLGEDAQEFEPIECFDYLERKNGDENIGEECLGEQLKLLSEATKLAKEVQNEQELQGEETTQQQEEEPIEAPESEEIFYRVYGEAREVLGCSLLTEDEENQSLQVEGDDEIRGDEFDEVSEEVDKNAAALEEMYEKIVNRKRFVVYYVSIDEKSGANVKDYFRNTGVNDILKRFFDKNNFASHESFDSVIASIIDEVKKVFPDDARGLFVLVNGTENRKSHLWEVRKGDVISDKEINSIKERIPSLLRFKMMAGLPLVQELPDVSMEGMMDKQQFKEKLS